MRDPTLQLLRICGELGLLALRDLYVEIELLAGGKEFTSAELVGHASLPENQRLRAAIEAACGTDCGAGKLGKLFARLEDEVIAGIAIYAVGNEGNAVVWSAKVNPERTAIANAGSIISSPLHSRE